MNTRSWRRDSGGLSYVWRSSQRGSQDTPRAKTIEGSLLVRTSKLRKNCAAATGATRVQRDAVAGEWQVSGRCGSAGAHQWFVGTLTRLESQLKVEDRLKILKIL